jgi:hypothetical protein
MQQQSTGTGAGFYRFKRYKKLPLPQAVRVSMFKYGLLEKYKLEETRWYHNSISTATNHGFHIIAQRLCGNFTHDLEITQGKIGTGTSTPTPTDTDLETVSVDGIFVANQTPSQSSTDATATLEFFVTDEDLPDGTYTEWGIFAQNQLIARSLINPNYTKSTGEDTSAEHVITLSNA